jgi:hypothetical protein
VVCQTPILSRSYLQYLSVEQRVVFQEVMAQLA